MEKLAGRTALVTGAGQGVGQGIALALAAAGASVGVAGRTFTKLEHTVAEINRRGGNALAIECDVKDSASLKNCVESVVAHFGSLNILVNNAQEVALGPIMDVSDTDFDDGWKSGPLATFRLMKLCFPYLRGDGNIINLASTSAYRWDAGCYGTYACVKEAIRTLSRSVACEWGKEGIRTNVILPCADSPALQSWMTTAIAEDRETFLQSIPMGRIGECERDIGRFVVLLCTDEAGYVNGQSIAIDGGQAFH